MRGRRSGRPFWYAVLSWRGSGWLLKAPLENQSRRTIYHVFRRKDKWGQSIHVFDQNPISPVLAAIPTMLAEASGSWTSRSLSVEDAP